MDYREELKSFNDVVVSEEEIKKYETTKLSDDVLSKMKKKTKMLYKRISMEESFRKVEKQFEDGEKVKYVFWAETYGVRKCQMGCGGYYSMSGAAWTSWPTKTGIILTNKGIFGVEANDAYVALKIKHFKFNEVEYIQSKKFHKDFTVLTILPTKGEKIQIELYDEDNHIKFIDFIKNSNIKLDIRMISTSRKEKIQGIIITIFVLMFLILIIFSAFYRSGLIKG
ncbi:MULTISPECIES: hypothetical protein [Clostridium]|uniref:hypothetical protein n=1 Tax=Clostridium TaxID=1485 RepID=UPI000826F742|nr:MULTISPECIES: hypothetical protein [Clostridium]PJI09076.1 hypothetical protein CUB90_14895 [Clostridium sp. CT7]